MDQIPDATADAEPPSVRNHHLLRKTFGFELACSKCHSQLRLIALIKTDAVAQKILKAMHLPSDIAELHPVRSPPGDTGGGDDWLN